MYPKIFPSVLIALDVAAGVVYAVSGNLRWTIYWFAAAVLTATVTLLRKDKVMTHRDFEMTEEDLAIAKQISRENIKEAIAFIISVPLFVLLFWLFLFATPDQMSAECDYLKYQMQQADEAKGK